MNTSRPDSLQRVHQHIRAASQEIEQHSISDRWPAYPDIEALLRILSREVERELDFTRP